MGDNTKTAQDLVNDIRKILDDAMEDAQKVDVKGNKAASVRLRKLFKLVSDEAKSARQSLLGKDKTDEATGDQG